MNTALRSAPFDRREVCRPGGLGGLGVARIAFDPYLKGSRDGTDAREGALLKRHSGGGAARPTDGCVASIGWERVHSPELKTIEQELEEHSLEVEHERQERGVVDMQML